MSNSVDRPGASNQPFPGARSRSVPQYLAYALPHDLHADQHLIHQSDSFDLHDVPLGGRCSFIDYEGVCLFGGAFESVIQDQSLFGGGPSATCEALGDLDLREREYYTTIGRQKAIVFLVSALPVIAGKKPIEPHIDLFRRILRDMDIHWEPLPSPVAHVASEVPEFQLFIECYGAAHISYVMAENVGKTICEYQGIRLGFSLSNNLFVLPCAHPHTHLQAVEMALAAIKAVRAYRLRVSEQLPEWLAEYRFTRETDLLKAAVAMKTQLAATEASINGYLPWKGVLCFRSESLVQAVSRMCRESFDIEFIVDDKYVEDATLRDHKGSVLAVLEIKGVNGNFARHNINQVDSHRERLGLPATTGGILIMNTMINAKSLVEKDQLPHPDIIKKAVIDNVLLIRTLDLLRLADLCQLGRVAKSQVLEFLLTKKGWLRVAGEAVTVVSD